MNTLTLETLVKTTTSPLSLNKWSLKERHLLKCFWSHLSTAFDEVRNKRTKRFHVLHCLGAQIVGINCHFDPETCVKTVKMMKEAVEKAGLKAHYMSQPLAYHTPDCNCQGFIDLPEFPFSRQASKDSNSDLYNTVYNFTNIPSGRSGAQDTDQMGHAKICPGGL